MNRRTVLSGAAVLGSAALAPIAALAGPRPGRFQGTVLVDRRVPGAARFAHEARRLGSQVTFTDGDLTELWAQDLEQDWRMVPSMIAGLTRPGPAWLLQLMAQRNRMRLAVRIDHHVMQTGLRHEVVVPTALAARARRELGADWIAGAAGLVLADPAAGESMSFTLEANGPGAEGEASRFVSWLIAPVRPAHVSIVRTA